MSEEYKKALKLAEKLKHAMGDTKLDGCIATALLQAEEMLKEAETVIDFAHREMRNSGMFGLEHWRGDSWLAKRKEMLG